MLQYNMCFSEAYPQQTVTKHCETQENLVDVFWCKVVMQTAVVRGTASQKTSPVNAAKSTCFLFCIFQPRTFREHS